MKTSLKCDPLIGTWGSTDESSSVTYRVSKSKTGYSVVAYDLHDGEVADVFEVPLEFLMNPANHRHHIYDWSGQTRHWISMSYQEGEQERFIWGATAGMLRNFYRFLLASDSAGTGGVAMINP